MDPWWKGLIADALMAISGEAGWSMVRVEHNKALLLSSAVHNPGDILWLTSETWHNPEAAWGSASLKEQPGNTNLFSNRLCSADGPQKTT